MVSSTKIMPLPHATTAERDANYTNVPIGSLFFNTDTQSMEITRDGGTTWDEVSTSESVTVRSDFTSLKTNFVVTNGGTGYAGGDFIKPSGGTAVIDANVRVAAVGGGGEILGVAIIPPDSDTGVYSSDPSPLVSNPVDTVTGSGSGAEITFELESSGEITANPENFDALKMDTPHGYLQLPNIPVGFESSVPMNVGGIRYLQIDNNLHYDDGSDRTIMSDEDIPLLEKGDLLVRNALGSNEPLPVTNTDDYVLTSDDAEPLGMKWAPASGGASNMQEAYDGGSVVTQALGQKTEFVFADESTTQFEFSTSQVSSPTPLRADQSGANSSWYSEWEWTHNGRQFFGRGFDGFVQIGSLSSASRTLAPDDFSKRIVPTNGSPITLTLPAGAVANIGGTCLIAQGGLGSITVQAPAGVELNGVDGGSFVIDNPASVTELVYADGTSPNKYFISVNNAAKCHGGMYFKNNATITTIVTQNVPVKVNATYIATLIQENMSNSSGGTLTIGTIQPGDYYVECHIGARAGSTLRNNYTFYIRQNNANNTESLITVSLDNQDTHVRFPTAEVLVNVSSADTFELWVLNNDGTQNIEVDSIYYTLKRA